MPAESEASIEMTQAVLPDGHGAIESDLVAHFLRRGIALLYLLLDNLR